MNAGKIWAVLPIKSLDRVKQRMSQTLTQPERTGLFEASFQDVLHALSESPSLGGVLVVTCDPRAEEIARTFDAHVLNEPESRGHTSASSLGAATLADEGLSGMLQVPGDLPLLSPEDIEAVLSVHGTAPAVTIAPSADEKGSNAVVSSPPDFLPLRFGDDSFYPHCAAARGLGIEPKVVRRPAFELDLDTPEDLRRFASNPSDTRTYAYLRESGLLDRVLSTG